MDFKRIGVSTGSACSPDSLDPSLVLLAIGLKPEEAHGSMRATIGRFTKEEDIDYFLEKLPPTISRLRKMSPLKKGVKYMFEDEGNSLAFFALNPSLLNNVNRKC